MTHPYPQPRADSDGTPPAQTVMPTPIPADLPFTVRPSRRRSAVFGVLLWLGTSLLVAPVLVLWTLPAVSFDGAGAILAVTLGTFAMTAAVAGFTVFAMTSGGPLMACDAHGLWIRFRKFPAQAVCFPWEALSELYFKRWIFDKVLCVSLQDSDATADPDLLASWEQASSKLMLGARLSVSTLVADHRPAQIAEQVAHWSHGQVRVR